MDISYQNRNWAHVLKINCCIKNWSKQKVLEIKVWFLTIIEKWLWKMRHLWFLMVFFTVTYSLIRCHFQSIIKYNEWDKVIKTGPPEPNNMGAIAPPDFGKNMSKTFLFKRPWITPHPFGFSDFPTSLQGYFAIIFIFIINKKLISHPWCITVNLLGKTPKFSHA